MILIAYDGSPDAKSAIEHAGTLLPGHPATVVCVWEPFITILTRTPAGLGPITGLPDFQDIDEATRTAAEQTADEGSRLACDAGIDATARAISRSGSIAEALLEEADRMNATAIVVGSRGLGGLGSMFLGSVSHALLQHADRPVLVVPSPEVAQRRHEHHHHESVPA